MIVARDGTKKVGRRAVVARQNRRLAVMSSAGMEPTSLSELFLRIGGACRHVFLSECGSLCCWLSCAVGPRNRPAIWTKRQPGLFLREDWKRISAATPITQEHVANPSLLLALYGPGRKWH